MVGRVGGEIPAFAGMTFSSVVLPAFAGKTFSWVVIPAKAGISLVCP